MLKRVACLFLVVLMSIDSLAAVVSDNDGSAFVTKAEFEELKADFASKIDEYNAALDGKIDGVISLYLSGLKLNKEPVNSFEVLKKNLGEVRFKNSIKTTNSSITTNEILNVYRQYFQKRYTGMAFTFQIYPAVQSNGALKYTMSTVLLNDGTQSSYSDQTDSSFLMLKSNGVWDDDPSSWAPNGAWIVGPTGAFTRDGSQTGLSTKSVYGTNDKQVVVDGAGVLYTYKITPLGRKVIKNYNTSYYPVCIINVYGHSYKDFAANFWSNYKGTTVQQDTTSLTCTLGNSDLLKYGRIGTGTPYADNYSGGTAATRWNAQVYTLKTTDGIDYERVIWGQVPTATIYCVDENANIVAGTEKTKAASDTQTTIKGEDWSNVTGMIERDVTLSGIKVTYTPPKLNIESRKIDYFTNDYVSTMVGETVYHGQGVKIGEALQDGDVKVTLRFKNGSSENASLRFILTNGKVGVTGTEVLNNLETVTCNGSTTVTRTVTFAKKGDLWINCYSNTSGVDVILDDVKLELP